MKKAELAVRVAEQTGQQPEIIVKIIDEFTKQTISRLAIGTFLEIKQFGCFEVVIEPQRESGTARIPAKRLPSFKSDDELTDARAMVNASIVQLVAAAGGVSPNTTEEILSQAFTAVKTTLLQGDRVTIEGFGTFEVMIIPPRTLIDPDTGESFSSREKRRLRFSSGKDLKVAVAEGGSPAPIKS
jgi:nucleoid DNA-binding protein